MKFVNKKVAILTSFTYVNPGYSLTGIVEDQCRMLIDHGHEVYLYACENMPDEEEENFFRHDPQYRSKVVIRRSIPKAHLIDYTSMQDITPEHKEVSKKMGVTLFDEFMEYDIDNVFTHDFIFTGWNLPYAMGIIEICKQHIDTQKIAWSHWVHSIPPKRTDWWNLRMYGNRHKIVFPNKSDAHRVAHTFGVDTERVWAIPHIKDYRSFFEFHEDTYRFIKDFPKVLNAQVVQIYPASTDRLSAKGVDKIISLFGNIKKLGPSVCLVVVNQWATGRGEREELEKFYKRIRLAGLKANDEVIFTSEWIEKYQNGFPRRILRELLQMSTIFIFPTSHESFGLVAPEAALCGTLLVNNRSLTMMMECQGGTGLYADFGSYEKELKVSGTEKDYFVHLSHLICARMARSEVMSSKIFNKLKYNWDNLYEKYYALMLAESDLW